MKTCVVWFNPNKNVYYHRVIKCHYDGINYQVGSQNAYGHEIVHIINNLDIQKPFRVPIRKRVVHKTIKFLKKYE